MTTTEDPAHQVVRLRPNVDPRALRRGAPWVYADQIVLDRRSRAIPAGSIVEVQDAGRSPIALAAFNAASKIALRILDRDPGAAIGTEWFAARFRRALALREALFPEPYYRLVHAEADGL
ncbi:MAG: RlmI/RlmK family 23S rRNA methyltransferase, partial [Rhodobacteraceae bacterium]|nr:RlmI/RlmK family 23S rRNA methyltransferase [Paracoccaceae bacterium]